MRQTVRCARGIAVALMGWLALAGLTPACRCGQRSAQPPYDLIPAAAQLVLEVDLAGLRRLAPGSLGGASARLRGVGLAPGLVRRGVLGAASSAGKLEFALSLRGLVDPDAVRRALRTQWGELRRGRVAGWTVMDSQRAGEPTVLLRQGELVLTSSGWRALVLDLARGRGATALGVRAPLSAAVARLRGERPLALLACQLAPALGRYLARRAGWPELSPLQRVEAQLRQETPSSPKGPLELRAVLTLTGESAARALSQRLTRQRTSSQALRKMVVTHRGRRTRFSLGLNRSIFRTLGRAAGLDSWDAKLHSTGSRGRRRP